MNTKEIITFRKEQETLLIPLYAKAQANPILRDEMATRILDRVQYDFSKLRVPKKTEVMLLIRAKQIDAYTERFIAAHPDALILHLGCGLDSRCMRVPPAHSLWFDLNLPDAIALRKKFYTETETYHMIASSVTDLAWLEHIPEQGRPVFVVAEGLMMYLPEDAVRALILCLHQKFSGGGLVFDAFSKLTADRVKAHPSLRKTGATVHWGIDDPRQIEGWTGDEQPGIRFEEEWLSSQSEDIRLLGWFYGFMFRLSGSISAARQAHRLLYYTL